MINIEYCRNYNTLLALEEIFGRDGDAQNYSNFDDYLESLSDTPLTASGLSERAAAKKLLKRCVEIAQDFGDLD